MEEKKNVSIKDLVKKLHSENPDLPKEKIKSVVELIFNEISNAITCGDKIELRGFGSFYPKVRKSSYARNPKTNEEISIDKHVTLNFKPSNQLLSLLNNKNSNNAAA